MRELKILVAGGEIKKGSIVYSKRDEIKSVVTAVRILNETTIEAFLLYKDGTKGLVNINHLYTKGELSTTLYGQYTGESI